MNYTQDVYKAKKYFSTTRNYTLSLLNAFNGIKYWVDATETELNEQREYTIPVTFGNYEKALTLKDLSETDLTVGNFNFLPRLVLSFEGMNKAPERQTNKFQKLTKRIYDVDNSRPALDVAYNSVAYDYQFTLLLQARGLTIASQVVEEIMAQFNPSMNLEIFEFPIFEKPTETQILISDPAFELLDEYEEIDINIVQVTMDITVRGNVYSPIEMSGPLETIKLFTHIWENTNLTDTKLANYYKFDISPDTNKVFKQTKRTFTANEAFDEIVESTEETVIENRPDYHKYQIETLIPENEYEYVDDSIVPDASSE